MGSGSVTGKISGNIESEVSLPSIACAEDCGGGKKSGYVAGSHPATAPAFVLPALFRRLQSHSQTKQPCILISKAAKGSRSHELMH
ncbi:hypothetical protein VFPPC_18750 [Pochonia chlamydosporia 170]|uniref:Uncharacterized protein n=1 Tax=Pochonia chlamydosporia 170 TaxID=1380566 RepID=A0A219ARX0_METCM|nr:hypothetical protein VFPPC_18750 [Pochonia chlamydosporia 170]OWT43523.1 hypothetical protein VFPPC_18750 [Pochonia chlamydosporia 170]